MSESRTLLTAKEMGRTLERLTVRAVVRNGDRITVWVNDRKVLSVAAKQKLSGRYALLGANGKYVFTGVQFEPIANASKE